MSRVTNVLLTFDPLEDEDARMAEVDRFFPSRGGFGGTIRDCGGTKYLEQRVAIGAFNYLNLEAFVGHLRTKVQWEETDSVQLFVCEQEHARFHEVVLFGLGLR